MEQPLIWNFSSNLFIDFQYILCIDTDRMILIVMSLFKKKIIDSWYV